MTPADMPDATDPALSVPLDTVCYLIARLHDLQGKSASTLSEGDTDDDPYRQVITRPPDENLYHPLHQTLVFDGVATTDIVCCDGFEMAIPTRTHQAF